MLEIEAIGWLDEASSYSFKTDNSQDAWAEHDSIYYFDIPRIQGDIYRFELLMKIDKLNSDCQWHISQFICNT